jgi:hypothetical protein
MLNYILSMILPNLLLVVLKIVVGSLVFKPIYMFIIIQTAIIVLTNIIIGVILKRQIKSQSEIINHYKGLVKATDPTKMIMLHEKEVQKITESMNSNIQELRSQVIELGNYTDEILNQYERIAKSIGEPELFNRDLVVLNNLPSCRGLLSKIHQFRLSETPKA